MNLPVVIVGLSTMKAVGVWPRRAVAEPTVRSSAAPKTTGTFTFTARPSRLDARKRGPPQEAPTGSTENTGSLGERASLLDLGVRPGDYKRKSLLIFSTNALVSSSGIPLLKVDRSSV